VAASLPLGLGLTRQQVGAVADLSASLRSVLGLLASRLSSLPRFSHLDPDPRAASEMLTQLGRDICPAPGAEVPTPRRPRTMSMLI
jgi:hypothetical protein